MRDSENVSEFMTVRKKENERVIENKWDNGRQNQRKDRLLRQ